VPDLDPSFLALPLSTLTDAALSRAKELGCSHADVRIERILNAYRSFRDRALESSTDGETPH
jgi:TldD protein